MTTLAVENQWAYDVDCNLALARASAASRSNIPLLLIERPPPDCCPEPLPMVRPRLTWMRYREEHIGHDPVGFDDLDRAQGSSRPWGTTSPRFHPRTSDLTNAFILRQS